MELIGKQIAIETILGQPPELHYPSWYAAQIEKLPPAPPEYLAEQAGILVTDADTISRRVAISAICNACGKIDCDKMDKCEKLQLPPANNSEIPNSSDTISRAKAIDEIKEIYEWHDNVTKERIIEHFKQLPPAQPEHIMGRWILAKEQRREDTENGNYMYNCSNCDCGDLHSKAVKVSYCWNCGADMRGEGVTE